MFDPLVAPTIDPEDAEVEQVRARLVLARQRARGSLEDLESAVRTELRTWNVLETAYRARPDLFVGAAFMAGFLLGSRR